MADETRTRILDAAEELFAELGFEGTSIRRITQLAGVNVAAVHYHFGSKEAVLRGVTDRVADPINTRRRELLARKVDEAAPQSPEVADLIEAFLRADVEILLRLQERGPVVARFLGRTYSDQTPWIQAMAAEQYAPSGNAFVPLLNAALPQLTTEEVVWRLTRVVAVIVHMFATWPLAGVTHEDAEVLIARFVTFLSHAMTAPPPD